MSPALLLGILLAVACLSYVLYPLIASGRRRARNARGGARAVSDEEIEAAIRSYRASHPGARSCAACGPRPEPDAEYCSSCGRRLAERERAP